MAADWSGVRVAITGHTGFKGAWLAYMLHRRGADVWGYALPPATQPNLYEVLGLESAVHSTFADINDGDRLSAFFAAARPAVVFHLAAQSLVLRGYEKPKETYATNVAGTIACLECALALDVGVTIVATSDKCYRNDGSSSRPFVETDPLGGDDPYSSSKAATEIAAHSYRTSFFAPRGLQLATVRAGNVIGGGDWSPDRLFTDLVRCAFEDAPLTIRYPHATRPWQHVVDALRGYLDIAQAALAGQRVDEPWNLGPFETDVPSVETIVRWFGQAVRKVPNVRQAPAEKHEAAALRIDAGKARTRLGWEPRLTIAAAVEATAHWYGAYYRGEPMRELTGDQIDSIAGQ